MRGPPVAPLAVDLSRLSASLCRLQLPLPLDLPEVPDAQGHDPGDDEDANDDETGAIDIEAGHEVPEAAAGIGLLGNEAQDLDGTDEEGHEDGQPGDGQVVVDLPDRA